MAGFSLAFLVFELCLCSSVTLFAWVFAYVLTSRLFPLLSKETPLHKKRLATNLREAHFSYRIPLWPVIDKVVTNPKFQVRCSIAGSLISAMCSTAANVKWIVILLKKLRQKQQFDENNKVADNVNVALHVFNTGTCVLLFLLFTERFRSAFAHRAFNFIPYWFYPLSYLGTFLGGSVALVSSVLLALGKFHLSGICNSIGLTFYIIGSFAFIAMFFRSTLIVAHMTDAGSELIDCTIRVTLCASLSLLSSSVGFTIGGVAVQITSCYQCNSALTIVFQLIYTIDPAINIFCLLCTYRNGIDFYNAVFGRVHRALRHCVSTARMLQAPVEMTISANATRTDPNAGNVTLDKTVLSDSE